MLPPQPDTPGVENKASQGKVTATACLPRLEEMFCLLPAFDAMPVTGRPRHAQDGGCCFSRRRMTDASLLPPPAEANSVLAAAG